MPHQKHIINEKLVVIGVSRELESGERQAVNRLRDICREEVEKGHNLIIDFSNVNICPSMVWGNMIVLAKQNSIKGTKIAVVGLRSTLNKTVKIIGMEKYVDIFENIEKAKNKLGGE